MAEKAAWNGRRENRGSECCVRGRDKRKAMSEKSHEKNDRYEHLTHDAFGPLYNSGSRVLVLGSFPSVKSREAAFYYGHPQNRFWPLMALLFGDGSVPVSREEKADLMLSHGVALWDVIESCDIIGSSDASIKNVQVTDVASLVAKTEIKKIFINGGTGYRLFMKYQPENLRKMAEKLPSTSPANAAWSLKRLAGPWKAVADAAKLIAV